MPKGAWILPAAMLAAVIVVAVLPGSVFAADRNIFSKSNESYYKDLPGVVPQEEVVKPDDYKCRSDIEDVYRHRGYYDTLFGDLEPTRIYTCKTKSGVTYRGTQMPNTQWVPGLNPYDLPR